MGVRYRFTTELWQWQGKAAWRFVTVPPDISDEIDELAEPVKAGFGSVKVEVTIGSSTWSTSLFPDSKIGSFILPVKAPVRKKEGLADGAPVEVALRVVGI